MIAKCVALLAVVAQINAYVCNSNAAPVVVSGCGSASGIVGSAGVVGSGIVGSGVVGSGVIGSGVVGSGVAGSGVVATRNIVARNKYPVALDNNGPAVDSRVPVTTSSVTAPVQEKPTVRLPSAIPAPRTVAHSCTCYKTILRPRVHDQYITVPTVQRYIETTHTPVVENIQYEAIPVNDNSGYSSVVGSVPVAATTGVVGSSFSAVPVASSISAVPVSSSISAVPVASSISAVPVSSSIQVASVPVTSYSTGISGCGSQSCCY